MFANHRIHQRYFCHFFVSKSRALDHTTRRHLAYTLTARPAMAGREVRSFYYQVQICWSSRRRLASLLGTWTIKFVQDRFKLMRDMAVGLEDSIGELSSNADFQRVF